MIGVKGGRYTGKTTFDAPEEHVTYHEKDGVKYAVLTGWNWVLKDSRTTKWGWTKTHAVPEFYVQIGDEWVFLGTLVQAKGDLEDALSFKSIASDETLHEQVKKMVQEGKKAA